LKTGSPAFIALATIATPRAVSDQHTARALVLLALRVTHHLVRPAPAAGLSAECRGRATRAPWMPGCTARSTAICGRDSGTPERRNARRNPAGARSQAAQQWPIRQPGCWRRTRRRRKCGAVERDALIAFAISAS
jgi:hypothetical protein